MSVLSIATLLSQHHEVMAVDIIPENWKNYRESVRFRMSILRST